MLKAESFAIFAAVKYTPNTTYSMIRFFEAGAGKIFAVNLQSAIQSEDLPKLEWLFGNATLLDADALEGYFVGPRKEMITPWSTNAEKSLKT